MEKIKVTTDEGEEITVNPYQDIEKDYREGRSPFTVPREHWGPGPWDGEPDRVQFWAHGHPCLCLRGPFGAWNGYVGVEEQGPLVGSKEDSFEVHGGVTYSGEGSGKLEDSPLHGEYFRVKWLPGWTDTPDPKILPVPWWIGFDCSHAWDLSPALVAAVALAGMNHDTSREIYRTVGYCREQVTDLARQIAEYEQEHTP